MTNPCFETKRADTNTSHSATTETQLLYVNNQQSNHATFRVSQKPPAELSRTSPTRESLTQSRVCDFRLSLVGAQKPILRRFLPGGVHEWGAVAFPRLGFCFHTVCLESAYLILIFGRGRLMGLWCSSSHGVMYRLPRRSNRRRV